MTQWIVTPDKFLTEEESKRLRRYCEDVAIIAKSKGNQMAVRNRLIIEMALGTGLRVSELANLKVEEIHIRKGQSKRFLPMNQTLYDLFTEIKEEDVKTPFSFNPDFITKKIAKYYKTAKIKGANTHSLRKTFGSLLIQNNVADIYTVSKLLGHASVKTTEKYYVDLVEDNYKSALDGLNDII